MPDPLSRTPVAPYRIVMRLGEGGRGAVCPGSAAGPQNALAKLDLAGARRAMALFCCTPESLRYLGGAPAGAQRAVNLTHALEVRCLDPLSDAQSAPCIKPQALDTRPRALNSHPAGDVRNGLRPKLAELLR